MLPIHQRKPAPWMDYYDERIVEHLRDMPMDTAADMARLSGLPPYESYLSARLRALSQAAIVKPVEEGSRWYELGPEGERWLRGEMRPGLIEPEPDPRRGHVLG